jgi:hypothetical protein
MTDNQPPPRYPSRTKPVAVTGHRATGRRTGSLARRDDAVDQALADAWAASAPNQPGSRDRR